MGVIHLTEQVNASQLNEWKFGYSESNNIDIKSHKWASTQPMYAHDIHNPAPPLSAGSTPEAADHIIPVGVTLNILKIGVPSTIWSRQNGG